MPNVRVPLWQRRLLALCGLGLGLTGLGQMPIFSRYYVADIPGLAWLGDYRTTAAVHLALAAVFLCLLAAMAVARFGEGRARTHLSPVGWLLFGVAATGMLRVAQNGVLPFFPPGAMRYLDWTHLGLAVLLGLAAASRLRRSSREAPRRRGGLARVVFPAHKTEHGTS